MIGRFKATHEGRGIHVMFGKAIGMGWYMNVLFTTAEVGDAVYSADGRYIGKIESIEESVWEVCDGNGQWFLSEDSGHTVEGGEPHYQLLQSVDGTDKNKMLQSMIAFNAPHWAIEKVRGTNEYR